MILALILLLVAAAAIFYYVTLKNDKVDTPTTVIATGTTEVPEAKVSAAELEPYSVANELRTSSRPFGDNSEQRVLNNQGYLNSPHAWIAFQNKVGETWYQMDIGKATTVYGVAIQGRQNADEWVTSFTVKYVQNGLLTPVDKGFVFTGNTDRETVKKVMFAAPITARYIRIYPKTYTGHMSLRAGVLIKEDTQYDVATLKLMGVPASQRAVSSWWRANDMPQYDAAGGMLNGPSAWLSAENSIGQNQYYDFKLTGVHKISGIAIQGRDEDSSSIQWITEFIVKYMPQSDSVSWQTVNGGQKMYGPGDNNSTVWSIFDAPINASIIRIIPLAWSGGHVAGRFDLLIPADGSTTETYVIRGYSSRDD